MNAPIASHAGVRTSVRAPAVCSGRLLLAVTLLSLLASPAFAAREPAASPALLAADSPPDPSRQPTTPPGGPAEVDTMTSHTALGREFARGGDRHTPESGSGRDTSHVLPWGTQLWGEGGVGGMIAPKDVRSSFQVGFGGSALFRIEHGSRYSTHLHLEVQALPRSDQIQVIDSFGNLSMVSLGGNAMHYSGTVGGGVRAWHRLWVEGGVGLAHFNVRTGSDLLRDLDEPPYITAVRNTTGLAAEAQLAWRFPITDTQSMSVNLCWQGNRAGSSGRWLHYLPVRIGYRFL